MATYKVKAGDSWWTIAQKTAGSGANYRQLLDLNPNVGTLHPGDSVNVPGGTTQQGSPIDEKFRQRGTGGDSVDIGEPREGLDFQKREERSADLSEFVLNEKIQQRGTTPQPPREVGAGSIARSDKPDPILIGAGFSGAVPGGRPDFYQDFDFEARSYEKVRADLNQAQDFMQGFVGRETDNPVQVLRNRMLSDPDFSLEDINQFDEYGFWDTPFARQQVGAPMRTTEDRMVTSFLDYVERQKELYGEDWEYEIQDETDAQILEHLGLLEEKPGEGGGGGGYSGGYGLPSRMMGQGKRPRTSRQSSFVGLVNWRI